MTLQKWLTKEILASETRALTAINYIEKALASTNSLMKSKGMIHFDAHFRNIVTDGNEIAVSDFGLAMLSQFELSDDERNFFNQHKQYDIAMSAASILHAVLTTIFDSKAWIVHLTNFLNGDEEAIPRHLRLIARKYGNVTLIVDEFFGNLQHKSKLTRFPSEQIASLITQL